MTIEDRGERNAEEALAPPGGLAHRLRRPADIKSVALTGLFVLAVFYTMYFMRTMLLPLVLALLLSYLFTPVVRALGYLRIRPLFGTGIVLLGLIGAIGYGVSFLSEPAAGWIEKAPYSLQQLQQKLLPLKKPIQKVAQASGEIDKLTSPEEPQAKPQAVVVKRSALAEAFFTQGPEFVASAVVMLILLYFLLAYDGVFLTKIIRIAPRLGDKKRAVSIMREIEAQISRYLLTVTTINICLGIAVGPRSISSDCATR
jgi:predicted PurR-regulated permease PerM